MFTYEGIAIRWLGHDGYQIKKDKVIYIDPYQVTGTLEAADLVLISHEHSDHLSPDDLVKVVTRGTAVVTIPACRSKVEAAKPKQVTVVKPGDEVTIAGIRIEAVAAYNVNKFRSPGNPFHPREDGKVGFILTIEGQRLYHAGDTDVIPEMERAKGVDVAFLPVSGTYVMTAQEAAEAARVIAPKVAIPMHYGAIVGSEADAKAFQAAAPCRVEILTKG